MHRRSLCFLHRRRVLSYSGSLRFHGMYSTGPYKRLLHFQVEYHFSLRSCTERQLLFSTKNLLQFFLTHQLQRQTKLFLCQGTLLQNHGTVAPMPFKIPSHSQNSAGAVKNSSQLTPVPKLSRVKQRSTSFPGVFLKVPILPLSNFGLAQNFRVMWKQLIYRSVKPIIVDQANSDEETVVKRWK